MPITNYGDGVEGKCLGLNTKLQITPYLLEYKTTLHIRRPPPFTIFNFQKNTNIHISQDFMSLIVCIFNILELNNHLS
jgi:hypothetical protein